MHNRRNKGIAKIYSTYNCSIVYRFYIFIDVTIANMVKQSTHFPIICISNSVVIIVFPQQTAYISGAKEVHVIYMCIKRMLRDKYEKSEQYGITRMLTTTRPYYWPRGTIANANANEVAVDFKLANNMESNEVLRFIIVVDSCNGRNLYKLTELANAMKHFIVDVFLFVDRIIILMCSTTGEKLVFYFVKGIIPVEAKACTNDTVLHTENFKIIGKMVTIVTRYHQLMWDRKCLIQQTFCHKPRMVKVTALCMHFIFIFRKLFEKFIKIHFLS